MTDHVFTPSLATPNEVMQYMEGNCHHLAVALHRHLGWGLDVHLDSSSPYWEDPEDPDNTIATVLHVYAVDPDGNLWDIRGKRHQDTVAEDIEDLFDPEEHDSDEVRSEDELRTYVGYWSEDVDDDGEPCEPIDRPLDSYTDKDVEAAWAVAQRVLGPLWELPQATVTKARRRVGNM